MTSSASGSLTYTYLSDGTKVAAIKSDGTGERYIGSFVYTVPSSGSETLESAAWDEGRISFTKSGSTYTKTDFWFVKDHLGNVRTVVDVSTGLSAPQVVERNDYLPFGTRMNAGTAVLASNRFRLGGKENQTFGTLDLSKVDFGARMYDPFIAGWTTADPLAVAQRPISPYAYCFDNPLVVVDRDGQIGETLWDLVNVVMDAKSLVSNIRAGKTGAALVDAGGLIVDVAATALPFIPGGAGTAIKAMRGADKAVDAIKVADKATDGVKAANSASEVKKASSISFVKKPYSKSRPAYGKNQVEDVWNAAKDSQGKVYDPFTGEELIWDKTMPRSWDMGHKTNKEYRKLHDAYMKGDISKEDFLKEYRNPDNYHPQSRNSNRSRKYEQDQ